MTDAATGKQFGRYTYGENNPYRYTDPDGRLVVVDDAVVIGVGVLVAGCAASSGCRDAVSNAGQAAVDGARAVGGAINNVIDKGIDWIKSAVSSDSGKIDKPSTLTPGPNAEGTV